MSAVRINGFTKSYAGHVVLDNINLDIASGETHFLVGPNGCGKTTLTESLLGVREADPAAIQVFGQRPGHRELRRRVRACLQGASLHPQVRVKEHYQFLCKLYGADWAEAMSVCQEFGIEDLLGQRFGSLSGGQKKRVQVAGCLFGEVDLVVLDEPTSGVDLESRMLLWTCVDRVITKRGATLLATTHELTEAEDYGRNILVMRAGRIISHGNANELVTKSGLSSILEFPLQGVYAALPRAAGQVLRSDAGRVVLGYRSSAELARDWDLLDPDRRNGAERAPRLTDAYLALEKGN